MPQIPHLVHNYAVEIQEAPAQEKEAEVVPIRAVGDTSTIRRKVLAEEDLSSDRYLREAQRYSRATRKILRRMGVLE